MKFKINKNVFMANLLVSQRAMASKTNNMPALTGIKMLCEEKELVMVTSNGDISTRVSVTDPSLMIEDSGSCLVPGKLFCDIIRKLGGEEVAIELETDNYLTIASGSSDVTLNLLDVLDYPNISFATVEHPIKIKTYDLKELIRETTFAASGLTTKPILTGVNFKMYDDKLLAVATDSFRLSRKAMNLDDNYLPTSVVVPSKSLNELSKLFKDDTEMVEIYLDKNKATFVFDNVLFQTRLLEGNYPDTSRLIPVDFPIVLKFDKSNLVEIIDRVSTLSSNPEATPVVKFKIEADGSMNITSNSPELGTIKDIVTPLEVVCAQEIKISFSATYFLEALRAFSSSEVYVKFTGEIKPLMLEADNDPGLLELVLPLKTD